MDIEKLLKALDNEENKKLLHLTTQKIKDMKLEILKELDLPSNVLIDYMKKLKDYTLYLQILKDYATNLKKNDYTPNLKK